MLRIPQSWFLHAVGAGLAFAMVGVVTWTALWAVGLTLAIVATLAAVLRLTRELTAAHPVAPVSAREVRDALARSLRSLRSP